MNSDSNSNSDSDSSSGISNPKSLHSNEIERYWELNPDSRNSEPISLEQSKIDLAGGGSTIPKIFSRDPLFVGMLIVFALVVDVFYSTDFRKALEDFFYDTRINWMPDSPDSKSIVVVKIDDDSIDFLERDLLRLRTDSQKRSYLSVHELTRAASILANTDARAIAFLMPEHAFPASDLDMDELRDIVKYDRRMVIGTSGYNQPFPNLGQLPIVFQEIEDQVFGFETFRSRSNAVVRSLPFTSFRGLSEMETLPSKVASLVDPSFAPGYGKFYMKHHPPAHFPSVSIKDLIENPRDWMDYFKNKIVVVGYVVARDAGFQTAEQMMVNTPLTGMSSQTNNGISSTWLIANAIENLVNREHLIQVSGLPILIQTVVIAAICGLSWEFGSLIAAIVTIAIWVLVLTVHSLIYQWLSVTIPLSDSFLATVLISIFAATRRMKIELMAMALTEARATAKSEIAEVQSLFLSGFASWLKRITEEAIGLIRLSQSSMVEGARNAEIYQRVYAAGEDFSEYLEAIRQIPEMESIKSRQLKRVSIDLEEFIKTILRRFDVKLKDRNIKCEVDVSFDAATVRTNPQLLDAILFNLISNAIKYGPDNSTVYIRIRKLSGGGTTVSVIDQGPGIPHELRDRIFERFYRIRDDRMYAAKGTGLGLYLCRFFAEAIGAQVYVVSEVGHGSEFRLVLP